VHAANHPTSQGKMHTCRGGFLPQGTIILQSNIGALLLCVFWDQFRNKVCWDSFQFVRLEVEKGWQKASIWKTGIRISKLIKEWVNECLNLDKRFKKILANRKVNKEMCNDISGVMCISTM
jgi:hypothetical protein